MIGSVDGCFIDGGLEQSAQDVQAGGGPDAAVDELGVAEQRSLVDLAALANLADDGFRQGRDLDIGEGAETGPADLTR